MTPAPSGPAGPSRNGHRPPPPPIGGRAWSGLAVAAIAALVSGVSVYVNAKAVHAVASPAVYTTAKNLVATVVLGVVALLGRHAARRRTAGAAARFVGADARVLGGAEAGGGSWRDWGPRHWLGLAYVGLVGGGLAFVVYFDGLAATTAAPAAFWRDTLVVWVAILAVPFLHERIAWWNVGAVVLLVAGEVALAGGVGHLRVDHGEVLVLASSALWAVEVVIAKVLLRDVPPAAVALVRMGVGAAALLVFLAADGDLHALVSLGAGAIAWVLCTGLLLACYVATWFTALARARALDVTSVLVASALVTWALQAASGDVTVSVDTVGLGLIAAGAALLVARAPRRASVAGRRAVTG